MDFAMCKGIIDQAAGNIESIELGLMGESALHPRIFDIIRYCKKQGLLTMLESNMLKTDMGMTKGLKEAGLDMLVMSIDGASKNTYEAIRKGSDFEVVKENIENVLASGSRRLFKVVQMVYNTQNSHEASDFLKMWQDKGADYVRLKPYENIDKKLVELSAVKEKAPGRRKACIQMWWKFAILWDGTAVICCNDYDKFSVIGDARKDNIREIWNGAPMMTLRKKHLCGDFDGMDFCRECRVFAPSPVLSFGSTFVDPHTMRHLFFIFEKMMIKRDISFFRYF